MREKRETKDSRRPPSFPPPPPPPPPPPAPSKKEKRKPPPFLPHPVVRRDPRLDPGLQQRVDHLVVERDALGVDRRRRRPAGHDARPRDRHAELVHAHPLHQRDVLRVLVVEVVGDVAGVLGEGVPDGDAAAALAGAALDLVGGGRDAPAKGRRGGDAAAAQGGGGVLGLFEEAAAEGAGWRERERRGGGGSVGFFLEGGEKKSEEVGEVERAGTGGAAAKMVSQPSPSSRGTRG